jgi:hypothetical protein
VAKAVSPNFSFRPLRRGFLEKIVQGVAYKKLKLEDGKDMEINVNLVFIYFNGHGPGNSTTFKDKS